MTVIERDTIIGVVAWCVNRARSASEQEYDIALDDVASKLYFLAD